MKIVHENLLWNIPIPVQTSQFQSLHSIHKNLNIETELARLTPFHYHQKLDENIMMSDLQTNCDTNVQNRLGSGRSGFYKGKYLKGVGRTLLAGNWNNVIDNYHNSGHLLASAGLKEYFVSLYFKKSQKEDTIVSCEGLLLKKLPNSLKNFVGTAITQNFHKPLSMDKQFQAITVKDGNFARFSNLTWYLDHPLTGFNRAEEYIGQFFHYLHIFSDPTNINVEMTPTNIAKRFTAAITRAIHNFKTYHQLGVYWGSYHNNFTIDGRFLDLEVPSLIGFPAFGVLYNKNRSAKFSNHRFENVVGLEVFSYIYQARYFVKYLFQRLEFLCDNHFRGNSKALQFTKEFLRELARQLQKNHLLMQKDKLLTWTHTMLIESHDLSKLQSNQLRHFIEVQYSKFFEKPMKCRYEWNLKPVPIQYAKPEPALEVSFLTPSFMQPSKDTIDFTQDLNQSLMNLESQKSIDKLFSKLLDFEQQLLR